jgi:hypothetical protein
MLIGKACLWCRYWLVSYLHSLSLHFAKGKMSSEFLQNPVLMLQIGLSILFEGGCSCPKQRLLCYKVLQELVCNNKKLKAHLSFCQPYTSTTISITESFPELVTDTSKTWSTPASIQVIAKLA